MTFQFVPALREAVPLIIALAGASGSGKTLSALKLARGLAGGDDRRIAVIDTEASRAKHYAIDRGGQGGPDRFAFHHGDLHAPFSPEAYAQAIAMAEAQGFAVIVIDSCSHEYEGEGGVLDLHAHMLDAAVIKARERAERNGWRFDETQARERANATAWIEAKTRHKRFVARLLQCRAHLILCLRADEKLRIEKVKDEHGRERTVFIQTKDLAPPERWVPICEKRFMYEMATSLLLTPQAPGVPIPVKLQAQHRDAVPLDTPLSEQTGARLAAWAAGASEVAAVNTPQPTAATGAGPGPVPKPGPAPTVDDYLARWETILADATEALALATKWNAERPLRNRIAWPDDGGAYNRLRAAVMAKVEQLKAQVPA